MALCEAMICGVPVLSADCPTGPREILAPDSDCNNYSLTTRQATPNGFLLPMADKKGALDEWSSAALELLGNEEKQKILVVAAKERMQSFDKPVIVQKWLRLIETVLSSTGK